MRDSRRNGEFEQSVAFQGGGVGNIEHFETQGTNSSFQWCACQRLEIGVVYESLKMPEALAAGKYGGLVKGLVSME